MRIVKGRDEMPLSIRQLPENHKLDNEHLFPVASLIFVTGMSVEKNASKNG